MNIYDIRRRGTVIFILISVAVVAIFLHFSNSLVKDLSLQERARMQIWADATREIASSTYDDNTNVDINFLLRIIQGNRTIPVVLTDDSGNILDHRNFKLPEPPDSLNHLSLSTANETFLRNKVKKLSKSPNVIDIAIAPGVNQHLYYEDSTLLKRLSLYPYVVLAVMLAFIVVVYFAVTSSKKAEQNKVWVGLSKETAHQLGTPISSLMAWVEILESEGIDHEIVSEMDKDVNRLSTIASRFSKIGSRPQMESENLNDIVQRCASYMSTRISRSIELKTNISPERLPVMLSSPLIEWVMENLIKNAVDAMEGRGTISINTIYERDIASVEVTDTGKGMQRKHFKTVFRPGYTTKKRGWGLGLTLAKRIVEQYHSGRIFVKTSEPGIGTTFRIELPLSSDTTK